MRPILRREGLEIADVACRHRRGRGQPEEHLGVPALVFVRRGCFTRTADGEEALLDPTLAYFMLPGEEQRYDHPFEGGDDCTTLFMSPELLASIWGGSPDAPRQPLRTAPDVDLGHRRLLAIAEHGEDPEAAVELAFELSARALESLDEACVASGRPETLRSRRLIAREAREALSVRPGTSLTELAGLLSVSPHHLSRVFREQCGLSVSHHRMRVRARDALDRLAGGERDLGRVAADSGFADQSHLTRVLRRETDHTPSALREMLGPPLGGAVPAIRT